MEEPKLIKAQAYPDERGWFMESFNRDRLRDFGIDRDWVQDNHSFSRKGVVRGIHYQLDGQAKLVRCLVGSIVDVVVDLRMKSPVRGQPFAYYLSGENGDSLYVPPGFGHSFLAVEDSHVMYKVDKPWNKELERGIAFDDDFLSIGWSLFVSGDLVVSEKDRRLPSYWEADVDFDEGVLN